MARRRFLAAGLMVLAHALPVSAQEIGASGEPSAGLDQPPLADMALGPANARVTVMEYASASGPHCAGFHISHSGAPNAAYIKTGKIRFILREYPHNGAGLAAFMVARCAPPESYFAYLDRFLTTQGDWLRAPHHGLWAIAQGLGTDAVTFETCLKNEKLAKAILEGRNLARSHGTAGTPTFFINGERYTGDRTYEGLSAAIDNRPGR